MNSTPTGGSATPSAEDDEPAADVTVPAQRSGAHPLPRRARPGGGSRDAGEPDGDPGWDPDGRPYAAADPATLDRLLSGLRDI